MDDFACESTIAGARVFHTSESKQSRILWLFVYFLAFVLIGFYVFNIFNRYQIEPEFSYDFSQIPIQEIPFPAVTICSPLFSRANVVNLKNVLKNPKIVKNYTGWQHTLLAANVQACIPELGSKIDKICRKAEPHKIVKALKLTFNTIDEATNYYGNWRECLFNWRYMKCSKLMNHVLTDFGFCFSYNLEGFSSLFNTEIIADDFKCYERNKLTKNYDSILIHHDKTINDANQTIDWTLSKGYNTGSKHALPARALYSRNFGFHGRINSTDLDNLCIKIGKTFLLFFHMPSEILTPFHQPTFITNSYSILLKAKLYKRHENLRPFPPHKRNCYYEGERNLKFFKTYTKAHCQFECLANFTLAQCGCVKFSMPREKSTRVCGLKDTSCYIRVAKNWNLTCDCLQPCTYIEYVVRKVPNSSFKNPGWVVSLRMHFYEIFGEKIEVSGIYGVFQGFADFGGMLGAIFGASLISIIEIFYFLVLSFVRRKFNTQESSLEIEVSEFANSSTIHGIQFIFDKSRHKFVRFFWIFAFIFAFSCCINNSRESYWKLNVVPETESSENLVSAEQIPFPAISFASPIFAKGGLAPNAASFGHVLQRNKSIIKTLTSEQFYFMIANSLGATGSNMIEKFMKYRAFYSENNKFDYGNHRFDVDLFPYLFQSHLEVNELFFNCKFQEKPIQCSKLFRKVMTIWGICYTFNMQSHNQIFNKEISKNFDSYGKFENQKLQWTLDQGYLENSTFQTLARASKHNTLEFGMKLTVKDFNNRLSIAIATHLLLHLPNEVLIHFLPFHIIYFDTQNSITISAKTKRSDRKLRKFLPQNRGCYFQDERKLQFFKSYTKINCLLECFSNYTLKSCGCIIFLLPHNDTTKICNKALEMGCYNAREQDFPPYEDKNNPCDCLPTCNDIEYKVKLESKDLLKVVSKGGKIPNKVIYFKFQFDSSKNIEEEIRVAFGLRDFLVNVGGFLGLYLGCSVISVFEVFYFILMFLRKKLKLTDASKGGIKSLNLGPTLVEIFNLNTN